MSGLCSDSSQSPRSSRQRLALDVLLGCGILLTTASQFRAAGFPLAPGELLFVIWIAAQSLRALGSQLEINDSFRILVLFWSVFFTGLSIGYVVTLATNDPYEPAWLIHDVIAYLSASLFSCFSVAGPDEQRSLLYTSRAFVASGMIALLALALAGAELISLPVIDTWYWDRFRGWSAIPNQLALLCLALGFLALDVAGGIERSAIKISAAASSLLPFGVGWATKSDAFRIALLASGVCFCILSARQNPSFRSIAALFRTPKTLSFLTASLALLAVSLPSSFRSMEEAVSGLSRGSEENLTSNVNERGEIWRAGLDRAINAAMLGLGPGPHLQIPDEIVQGRQDSTYQPANIDHPEVGEAPNFEAHNTFIDVLVQSGVVGLCAYISIIGLALFRSFRASRPALLSGLLALTIFGSFHYSLRHPTLWLMIALCMVAPADRRSRLR